VTKFHTHININYFNFQDFRQKIKRTIVVAANCHYLLRHLHDSNRKINFETGYIKIVIQHNNAISHTDHNQVFCMSSRLFTGSTPDYRHGKKNKRRGRY
jgi:hypothetical protein